MIELPYFEQVRSLWKPTVTGSKIVTGGVAARSALTFLILSRLLSLSVLKFCFGKNTQARQEFMHVYVCAWTTILAVVLFACPPFLSRAGCFLAAYEIADILLYRLYFVFIKSHNSRWKSSGIRRTLVMVFLNVIEIVLGFAVLYHKSVLIKNSQDPLSTVSPISAMYFSLTTITTVGFGDFIPANDHGRLLVSAQIGASMLFLILVLPAVISIISTELHHGQPD